MMDEQKRTRLLLWIIVLGIGNFILYAVIYAYLGGDAPNGAVHDGNYHLRGHFFWRLTGQPTGPVSREVWLYSFIHSITIWPTIAAVLVSMLVLARPHIIATMKAGSWIGGQTFVTIFITVIILVTSASTLFFVLNFARALSTVAAGGDYNVN